MERVWDRVGVAADPNLLQVELYRQFLFDEESVVAAMDDEPNDRATTDECYQHQHDDEHQSIVTQRTH
jgi:hypothetical protein